MWLEGISVILSNNMYVKNIRREYDNMFCPKCGNNNNDLNLWCIRCGCRLEESQKNTENTVVEEISVERENESVLTPVAETSTDEQKPKKIKDYMVWSIISAVLGSIAFGIIAVIFSGLTMTEIAAGNTERAKEYSDKAKLFCLISLAIAIVKVIFIVLTLIIVAFMTSMPLYLFIR